MDLVCGVGLDEVDVLVFLDCFLHKFLSHSLFLAFLVGSAEAEVAALAVDCLLEYERLARVCRLDFFDEREESFFNHLCVRIREAVEDECVNVSVAEHVCEIWLHLAVSAASEAEQLQACHTHQLHRIAHARTACADALGVARSEYADPVTERRFDRLQHSSFLYADLYGILLTVDRKIEHAFLHGVVHILDNDEVVFFFSVSGRFGCSIEPFPVLLDVQVITSERYAHCVGRTVHVSVVRKHGNHGRIGLEKHCKAG